RQNLFNPQLSDKLQFVERESEPELGSVGSDSDQMRTRPLNPTLPRSGSDSTPIKDPSQQTQSVYEAIEIHGPDRAAHDKLTHIGHQIRYFECGDRETEIRTIAKEIKRLILIDNYSLSDI